MAKKHLSRRQFLVLSATGAAGAILAACSPAATATTAGDTTKAPEATKASGAVQPTSAPAAGGKSPRGFVEVPFLAERVSAANYRPLMSACPKNPSWSGLVC